MHKQIDKLPSINNPNTVIARKPINKNEEENELEFNFEGLQNFDNLSKDTKQQVPEMFVNWMNTTMQNKILNLTNLPERSVVVPQENTNNLSKINNVTKYIESVALENFNNLPKSTIFTENAQIEIALDHPMLKNTTMIIAYSLDSTKVSFSSSHREELDSIENIAPELEYLLKKNKRKVKVSLNIK